MKYQICGLLPLIFFSLSASAANFPIGTFKCTDTTNKAVTAEIEISKAPGLELPLLKYKRFFQEVDKNNLEKSTEGLGMVSTDNYFKRNFITLGSIRIDFENADVTSTREFEESTCIRLR